MFYDITKRAIDIFGSIFLLILFSPLMAAVSIIIKLTSPGTIFVEPENAHMKRVGKDGKIFRLYKFRSMMVKADILEQTDPKYKHVYQEKHTSGTYKVKNDTRVTKV